MRGLKETGKTEKRIGRNGDEGEGRREKGNEAIAHLSQLIVFIAFLRFILQVIAAPSPSIIASSPLAQLNFFVAHIVPYLLTVTGTARALALVDDPTLIVPPPAGSWQRLIPLFSDRFSRGRL